MYLIIKCINKDIVSILSIFSRQDFGQVILTAAFVDDIISLVLFNMLMTLGGNGGKFDFVTTVC